MSRASARRGLTGEAMMQVSSGPATRSTPANTMVTCTTSARYHPGQRYQPRYSPPRMTVSAKQLASRCSPRAARRNLMRAGASSVEARGQIRVLGMPKHQLDLLGRGASRGQRRQFAARKEPDVAGFVARPGASADQFANEEHLVNRVDVAQPVTLLVIVDGRQLQRTRFESGLLRDFADDAFRGGLIDVRPPAGEGPAAVADFPQHEHLPVAKSRAAHVYLGGRVPQIEPEQIEQLGGIAIRSGGDERRRQFLYAGIPLTVEGILRELQAGFRAALECPPRSQPRRLTHPPAPATAQVESSSNSPVGPVPANRAKPGPLLNCIPATTKV